MKNYLKYIYKFTISLFLNMNFEKNSEFEKNNISMCMHRAKLFNIAVFLISFYNFYVDFILSKNININSYKKTLIIIHIITFILSIVYLMILKSLNTISNSSHFRIARIVLISDVFFAVFLSAVTSLNSQRFSGNISIYILTVILIGLIVPIYPRIIFLNYLINHIFFFIGLSFFTNNKALVAINQMNSTIAVVMAFLLFLVLHGYNIKNYLNDEKLKEDKLTFRKLFDLNPFPLLISSFKDGKILDLNDKSLKLYGITKEQFKELNYNNLYKNVFDLNVVRKNLEKYKAIHDYVVELTIPSGEIKWAIINYELIDYFGEKSILSGIADITEIKRLEDKLKLRASIDALTGVLNRSVGMDLLKNKLENITNENAQFSICFCDIDNLKFANDRFGHTEGDFLITCICNIIREEISPDDIIFRYGGDEFIIIFDNNYNINQVYTNIKNRLANLNKNNIRPYLINASLGLFSYKSDMNLNINEIIELADKEMYKDKIRQDK